MKSTEENSGLPCSIDEVDYFLSTPQTGTIETLRALEGDILVLGAGGKMGLHLCLLLKRMLSDLNKSNRLYAASRFSSLNSRSVYEENGIEVLAGDFRDSAFVDSLPDCPTVFYLVGAKFGTSDNSELLQQINVEVSARVSERFRNSKIVAFSTGCVYSYVTPDSGGAKEGSEMNPVGEYALSCLERERRFQSASNRFGTSVVLIRLNYSVEFRYGVLLDIGQKVLSGEMVDVTMGYVNLIWQNDALNQIIQTLEIADSPAVPINIAGPDTVAVRELAQRFGKHLGIEPQFQGEEAETMWLSDSSHSQRLFGKPSVELDRMIGWVAAWLRQGGATHGKPTGFEKRDGQF
jgi:nucleoside-diphosphate-sugar epimerase|tara:strand:- start:1727 stop:2773 length:1047 start_codon:yes stop_codon:yes gene_type:complete